MARDAKLDVVKGAMILAVVLGHFLEVLAPGGVVDVPPGWRTLPHEPVLFALYTVHMPLFVFFAGTTARSESAGRRIVQLLAMYVPMQVLLLVATGSFEIGRLPNPAFALWFLAALIIWLALTPLIERAPRTAVVVAVLIAVLAVAVDGPTSQLAVSRTLFYLPFFVLGHVVGWRVLRWSSGLPWWARPVALATWAGVVVVMVLGDLYPRWVMGTGTLESAGVEFDEGLLSRSAVLVAMTAASTSALVLLPGRCAPLEGLGQRSLAIYLLHQLPVVLVGTIVLDGLDRWTSFALGVAATVITLAVCQAPLLHRLLQRYQSAVSRSLGLD